MYYRASGRLLVQVPVLDGAVLAAAHHGAGQPRRVSDLQLQTLDPAASRQHVVMLAADPVSSTSITQPLQGTTPRGHSNIAKIGRQSLISHVLLCV